ncbi:hypothetical protein BH11PAT2_BH11PAT2_01310 [soil metagenome]
MLLTSLFHTITEAEKDDAVEDIIRRATPRKDFFVMLVLSVSMATFGVLLGSTVILVGSMLIAPLLYPLLSLSLGIILVDEKLIARSLYTIGKSMLFGLAAGLLIGFLFSGHHLSTTTLFNNSQEGSASLMYAIVAAIAGFAAAFAMSKPHLNETLPGVAISVALVPPLATAGVALSLLDWSGFSSALLLFMVNIIGIVFSAMIVFALMQFSAKTRVAEKVEQIEDRVIEKESISIS